MSLVLAILFVLAATGLLFAVQLNLYGAAGRGGVNRPRLTRWLRWVGLALFPFGVVGSVLADRADAPGASIDLFQVATFMVLGALIFNEFVAKKIGIGRRRSKGRRP